VRRRASIPTRSSECTLLRHGIAFVSPSNLAANRNMPLRMALMATTS
jgi:hypothetical protein